MTIVLRSWCGYLRSGQLKSLVNRGITRLLHQYDVQNSVEGISIEVIELRHGEKLPQIAIQTTDIGARNTVENNPLVQV